MKERKRKFPLPPAASTAAPVQSMPFQPGQVLGVLPKDAVGGSELTPQEQALLQQAGFRDGDPLPNLTDTTIAARMRAQVAQIKMEAEDLSGLTPVDPKTPPIEPPKPRRIEDMAPAERAQTYATLQEMNELQQRMNAARIQQQATEAMSASDAVMGAPGAAEAIAAAAAGIQQPVIELKDDVTRKVNLRKRPAEPAPQISSPDQNAAGSDLTDTPVICPRCGFDMNGELIEPTSEDKIAYVACVMGKQRRFRKQVSLFGDRIIVVFRSLLPKEVDMALNQADAELNKGRITNVAGYARATEWYKLCAGIESIQRAGSIKRDIPEVDDVEFDETENPTAYPEIKEYLDSDVFITDSVRKAIGTQWIKFNQILQYLEAKADSPDFF